MPGSYAQLALQSRLTERKDDDPSEPHLVIELRKSWTSAVRIPVTMWTPSRAKGLDEYSQRRYGNLVALFNINSEELVAHNHVMSNLDKEQLYSTFKLHKQEKNSMIANICSTYNNTLERRLDKSKKYHQQIERLEHAHNQAKEGSDIRMLHLEDSYKDMEKKNEETHAKIKKLEFLVAQLERAHTAELRERLKLLEKKVYKEHDHAHVRRTTVDFAVASRGEGAVLWPVGQRLC